MLKRHLLTLVCLMVLANGPGLGDSNSDRDASQLSQPRTVEQKAEYKSSAVASEGAKGGGEHNEECSFRGPSWFAEFYCFFAGHDKFWVSFGTLVLAAFTTILGFATIILARATNRLVSGADKSSEQQLRAYVSFTPQVLANAYPERLPIAKFRVKNTGQTPAYNVRYVATLEVLPHPLVDDQGDLVAPAEGEPTPVAGRPIHSQEHIDGEAIFDALLTHDNFVKMNGPDCRLYLAGIIWYEDIFEKVTRKTKFCVYIGGPEFLDIATAAHVAGRPVQSLDWSYSHVHNEAT